ncbi:MAG TPA: GGDEF domain-containing response regulator [Gammaproteobacteria bacterium]|nr:GGDEF domain-containing response regulator [Gammaproteobacteria bacterium]
MGEPIRILLVEDSENDALLLMRELSKGGFEPSCHRVETREAMIEALEGESWDLVITDHNLPGFSSEAALQAVKESGFDIPVIIVSGSIGEDIAVAAMKTGAHDYIMKDNLSRLVPAIERELREVENRRAHRQAAEIIRHMAYHDALTGLTNRHEFERRLRRLLNDDSQQAEHALLYLDLDQFKIINDTCGHIAGDELLKQLAVVLQKPIRESDTLARLGGDEFGVLLESCGQQRAIEIAQDLLEVVREFRFSWQDKTFALGVSIGLVMIEHDGKTMSDLLSAADMSCYAAKEKGRSRIHVYRDDDAEVLQRHGEMQWVSRINLALEECKLVLHKQCIVPLGSHGANARHCEFLLRMRGENGELIMPGAFISAAERYDLMPKLDRWVIDAAFAHVSETMSGNSTSARGTCFINLSGASLSDARFFTYIREKINQYQIPEGMMCFEITETATIANLTAAVRFINDIKEAGCLFALDDFGSGMSSFSYLKTIPADYLKIDGMFVRDMLADPMDRAIVDAVNQIGHVAGLLTIAEFVETPQTLDALREMGVDYAQGFGIEKPMPLDEDAITLSGAGRA